LYLNFNNLLILEEHKTQLFGCKHIEDDVEQFPILDNLYPDLQYEHKKDNDAPGLHDIQLFTIQKSVVSAQL